MIVRLAWAELRQQLGGRVFAIVFAVSLIMVVGAMGIDELRVGPVRDLTMTGADGVVRTHLIWSLFFLFTAAAMVGEAVLRDDLHRFADLVRATPVSRIRYALARFLGAFAGVVLCFASVPLAHAIGSAVLGGGGPAGSYAFAFVALALPNLLLASALFFLLAGVTRSFNACLLGAAGLLTLYGLAGEGSGGSGLAEPFGFAAVAAATRGWSAARLTLDWPALGGMLLANRLLWTGCALALIVPATWLASRDRRARRRSRPAPPIRADAPPAARPPSTRRHAERIATLVQLRARSAFEVRRIVLTPAFAALLMMGLASAATATSKVDGTPAAIVAITASFQLVPVVVVLFFAGELFWAERDHGIAPIVLAAPVRPAVLVAAKLAALATVLLALAVASATAAALTELVRGGTPSLGRYVAWYVLPRSFDWLLLGVLALVLQSVAPNKLAGWGYMVFYLIGSLALNRLGWVDPHYRYGGYPGAPLPPPLSGAEGVGVYRLGWGLVAVAMFGVALRRGLPRPAR